MYRVLGIVYWVSCIACCVLCIVNQVHVINASSLVYCHSGVGSVAAVAAMAATLFWPKKNKNQSLLNVYDSGNRAYINKLWIIAHAL